MMLRKGSKEIEINWVPYYTWTCDWLDHYGWEVVDNPSYSPNLTPSDLHFFGPLKK